MNSFILTPLCSHNSMLPTWVRAPKWKCVYCIWFNFILEIRNRHVKTSLYFLALLFLTSISLFLVILKNTCFHQASLPFLLFSQPVVFLPNFWEVNVPFPLTACLRWARLLCGECLGQGLRGLWAPRSNSCSLSTPELPWLACDKWYCFSFSECLPPSASRIECSSSFSEPFFSLSFAKFFSSTYCLNIIHLQCSLTFCSKWTLLWHPTLVLLPGKSHGWRSLVGSSSWGHWESDMTERLHFHFSLSFIGEGNGNPLQYSCLENPRDRGAWWAAVYGVIQSWDTTEAT